MLEKILALKNKFTDNKVNIVYTITASPSITLGWTCIIKGATYGDFINLKDESEFDDALVLTKHQILDTIVYHNNK